jgi:ankyrin repeat protein
LKHGADPMFVHRSERIIDGRGGNAYDLRKEVISSVMAACGMGGGGTPWVEVERSQREPLALETVKLLVELGVDVNIANTDGRTALDGARALKFESVVAYLQGKGARSGLPPRGGGTPAERR